jgi:IS66 Orf2 like protein
MKHGDIRLRWLDTVSKWKKSSLTQKEWCLVFGLNPNTFNWWKKKLYPRKSIKQHVLVAFPQATRIFLYSHFIDIHCSFEKLYRMISESFSSESIESSHFIFLGKHRTYLKIFYLDDDGPNILFKRLERGAYVLDGEIHPKSGEFSIL